MLAAAGDHPAEALLESVERVGIAAEHLTDEALQERIELLGERIRGLEVHGEWREPARVGAVELSRQFELVDPRASHRRGPRPALEEVVDLMRADGVPGHRDRVHQHAVVRGQF